MATLVVCTRSTTTSGRANTPPKGADGKRIRRNVYAKTREECEEKLAVMIEETKREIEQQKQRIKQQKQRIKQQNQSEMLML